MFMCIIDISMTLHSKLDSPVQPSPNSSLWSECRAQPSQMPRLAAQPADPDRAAPLSPPSFSWQKARRFSWQKAGWSPTSLVDFVTTLRPLQFRNYLDKDFICSVTRHYLHGYIADLCTKEGFVMVMRSDVEDFLDIVHHYFSQCDAVLLPAKDAVSRLQALIQTQT